MMTRRTVVAAGAALLATRAKQSSEQQGKRFGVV
jgi:hypothetical protein